MKKAVPLLLNFVYHLNLFITKPALPNQMPDAEKIILRQRRVEDFWVCD